MFSFLTFKVMWMNKMGYYFKDWAEDNGFNMDFDSENFQGREALIKLLKK
jgi:hypothetical protein